MSNNRLNIISVSSERSEMSPSRLARKKELQARYDRLWLIDPEQFNPLRNCMQKERLDRTWTLIEQYVDLNGKHVVDLGSGAGTFSRRMRDAGAMVEAVDIAHNALKHLLEFDSHHIHTRQDAMPETGLPDENYELVAAMELIAELPPDDYRLFFAELARIIKPDGYLVCSSPIDIYTEGGVEKLLNLAQTEFEIGAIKKSYHALHIRLKNFFEAPSKYVEAWKNPQTRRNELEKRVGFDRYWFFLNSTILFMWIWVALAPLMKPILTLLKDSRSLLLRLESICEFISDDAGVSHLIFIAKRRPMHMEIEPENLPLERPKKREVWE
ncbi:MAG: class I SAM-dependent methyltransferase [Chlamydiales bacterium]